ncbi:MbtH family protein [Streptomyces filamentosus]|uniref:MbtH family protein n=1 Tax=Streptomyces filamentosus TaxID=67294 RepID=UPI0038141B70
MSDDEATMYQVVINDEKQYSIWPVGNDVAAGWKLVGKMGTKRQCLEYIQEASTGTPS